MKLCNLFKNQFLNKDSNQYKNNNEDNEELNFYNLIDPIYKIIDFGNCNQFIYRDGAYYCAYLNNNSFTSTNKDIYYHVNAKNQYYNIYIYTGSGEIKFDEYSLNINHYKENNLWFSDKDLKKIVKLYNSFKLLLEELNTLKIYNEDFYYYYLKQKSSLNNSQIELIDDISVTFKKLLTDLMIILINAKVTSKDFINSDKLIEECNKYNDFIKSNLLS